MVQDDTSRTRLSREALDLPTEFAPPGTALEKAIAQVFCEAFDLDAVGIDDEFFDLGGDSLLGEVVSMEIKRATDRDFPITKLFDHGTPRKIAAWLERGAQPAAAAGRPPIFMVHGRAGFSVPSPAFHAGLGEGQRLEIFEVPGVRGEHAGFETIEEIAAAYVAQVKKTWPEGPVLLTSFCIGALIALEMAAQLAAEGRPVRHMVLFDPGISSTHIMRDARESAEAGKDVAHLFKKRRRGWRQALRHLPFIVFFGRVSDGTMPVDFADRRLLRLRQLYFSARLHLARYGGLIGKRTRHAKLGLAISPRARLLASYRHYWPKAYYGSVDIICSAKRQRHFADPEGFWTHFLPNRTITVTSATHGGLNRADATPSAAAMQKLFDERLAGAAPPAA